jgi:outer membrane protein OmpA-like peptidoglycan-associated protein
MKDKKIFLFYVLIFVAATFSAQTATKVKLINPSFEDIPQTGKAPKGWQDCGSSNETPVDIHSSSANSFSVKKKPFKGETYVGMVTRDNKTWESISQRLSTPLIKGSCYTFSIYLCRAELYESSTKNSGTAKVNFNTPIKLRIWAGHDYCSKRELLSESGEVKNSDWQEYKFEFYPKDNHTYITFEAYYKVPVLIEYNGNVLLDNASNIVPFQCKKTPKPDKKKPDVVKEDKNQQKTKSDVVVGDKPKNTAPQANKTRYENAKVGETVRIENLYFKSDSASIQPESFKVLEELYQFMSEHSDVVIEVGGHTNNIPPDEFCNRLSTARAKEVSDYLLGRGVSETRIRFKGYGKTQPIVPNVNAANRQKNQRVEIKILGRN